MVDDLSKDDAYKLYEEFGFNDKGLVWDWIGGKVGDMVRLYEEKKQGYNEEEGLRNMLKDEVGRLNWIEAKLFKELERADKIWNFLKIFKEKERIRFMARDNLEEMIYWIQENILFYNPVEGTICPQGRLIHRAINKKFSE